MRGGVELDMDVIKALRWLAETTNDPRGFSQRLEIAQNNYIKETSKRLILVLCLIRHGMEMMLSLDFFTGKVFN